VVETRVEFEFDIAAVVFIVDDDDEDDSLVFLLASLSLLNVTKFIGGLKLLIRPPNRS